MEWSYIKTPSEFRESSIMDVNGHDVLSLCPKGYIYLFCMRSLYIIRLKMQITTMGLLSQK